MELKRIVVKVGTSTITHSTGKINLRRVDMLTRALADIMNMGHEVVLVSSGAVGVGVGKMGLEKKPTSTREKQALAAIGQAGLVSMYDKFFKEYGYNTGQVLLTKFILDEEMRYRSAKRAFETMIKYNVIPIVNENDVISSYVAELVDADLLVLMSDIDGFYTDNPNTNPDARLISVVEEITEEIKKCAGGEGSSRGTGGMRTKLKAAKIVNSCGIDMIITNGANPENLYKIVQGESVGTLFKSPNPRIKSRK